MFESMLQGSLQTEFTKLLAITGKVQAVIKLETTQLTSAIQKLTLNYKHLSQIKRYQIYALVIAGHDQTQIAKLLDRNKSTISQELSRNRGLKGYRPKQACATAAKPSDNESISFDTDQS